MFRVDFSPVTIRSLAQGMKATSKKENALSVEDRLAVAQQRRSTIKQEQEQLLTEIGESRAARQSAKHAPAQM
jgi:hypothetical protein